VTKPVRGIHHEKGWYFAAFSGAPGVMSPKILKDHSFPISHPFAKFCASLSSFRGDVSENVIQTHYNVDVGFSPTNDNKKRLLQDMGSP